MRRNARPNVVFVFADQWRAQATGYAGDPNVKTPCLDKLHDESVTFLTAVAGCPVCSPYRASLVTGQYPLTHGIILNDVCLSHNAVSLADAFNNAGYDTAYVGKWHLDGHGRSSFIPRERRQGFGFWKVMECTHDYNNSFYYADDEAKLKWDGYDAKAQACEAIKYITERSSDKPFALVLSWGPPHNPYETAPEEFRRLYDPARLILRPNVPPDAAERARRELAGYYAHISALDAYVGLLLQALKDRGLDENTIFVFTSDHGDMIGSQGYQRKQVPWDESIVVPFLLQYPAELGRKVKDIRTPFNAPDIMPTLLGLCDIPIPETVEGIDFSKVVRGIEALDLDATLIACYAPFGEWLKQSGAREYRGVRTPRYTYVRETRGPWLLYDNEKDPYQLDNLCGRPDCRALQTGLDDALIRILSRQKDEFLTSEEYIRRWGYVTDKAGTVPFTN